MILDLLYINPFSWVTQFWDTLYSCSSIISQQSLKYTVNYNCVTKSDNGIKNKLFDVFFMKNTLCFTLESGLTSSLLFFLHEFIPTSRIKILTSFCSTCPATTKKRVTSKLVRPVSILCLPIECPSRMCLVTNRR